MMLQRNCVLKFKKTRFEDLELISTVLNLHFSFLKDLGTFFNTAHHKNTFCLTDPFNF